MTRKILIVGAAFAALSLAACGQKTDETKGWSVSKLYSEARSEMSSGKSAVSLTSGVAN